MSIRQESVKSRRKDIPLEEFGDMNESNSDKLGSESREDASFPKHSRIPGGETYSQVISGT